MVLMKSLMGSTLTSTGKSARGFTLIELLVVIAIIGILSSVVLASLNSARQKGRDARRVSDLKQLQLALELYYDANASSGYPAAISGTTLTSPGYISVLPSDPGDGTAYGYTQTGSGTGYCLGALMETTGQTNILANDNDSCASGSWSLRGTADLTCATNATGGADEDSEAVYCVSP